MNKMLFFPRNITNFNLYSDKFSLRKKNYRKQHRSVEVHLEEKYLSFVK